MYRIIFHKKAEKKYNNLQRDLQDRIAKVIDSLAINPFFGKKLSGELFGCYRIRIGDFRIVYELDQINKIIVIIAIGSRGDVYK